MKPVLASWGTMCLWGMALGTAQAAGFALIEQNASGLGNAYAGQAAVAEDASTVFFNPAGLTRIQGRQVVVAGHLIAPSAKLNVDPAPATTLAAYGNGGDAGLTAFVPNAYYAMDIGQDLKFGIGVNAPFGLATQYDTPWAGQTEAVRSDLKTYNINPSLAWKLHDKLSLGVGLNWQRIEAELTQATDATAAPTIAEMQGDDGSWGWNAGVLWSPDGATRLGLAYRSQIRHELEGTLAPANLPIVAGVTLPETVSLSFFRPMTPAWDLLADITWTGWKSFDELRVRHAVNNVTLSLTDESWENVWRYSIGVNYHLDRKMTWRAGLAYDQTPVPDAAHRTPRIPDADRTWLAIGGQYRISPTSILDFGYAHLFVKDAPIAHTLVLPRLSGTYDNQVDIVSLQYTHNF